MVTAVIVSALIVAITGALVLSLTSGGRESARQRELYEARAASVSALEYLYAQLGQDPDFFDDMLAVSSPTTYDWIGLSSAAEPDTATNSDWRQFGSALSTPACNTRLDPCWTMRLAGDGTTKPRAVAVEAIVRFDCRGSGYCSVRRFQQQLRRTNDVGHSWQRSDLTEVTSGAALPSIAAVPNPPSQVLNVMIDSTTITDSGATVSWDKPTGAGTPTGYRVVYNDGSTDQQEDVSGADTLSVTLTGLTAATSHTVTVTAYNDDGDGTTSGSASFMTAT